MNVVIYARYSSDNQSEESITAQLRACNEFCRQHGYTVVDEYIDRAQSARSDDRPSFQKMIEDSKSKTFQGVVVHKLDRFSRDRYDHAFYKKELKRNGVRVLSVLEHLDDSPESVVLESVLEGFSEYYSRNLARETRKGLKEVALLAKFTGGTPPFGYDIDEDNNYVINPVEADAVKEIFNACLMGTGYGALIDEFDRRGLKTKFGRPFGKNSFNAILKNEKYIGNYIYYPVGTSKQKISEPIIVEDAIPAIVDKKTFYEVQEIMNSRKHQGKNKAVEPYILSGLLVCGECGRQFHGHRRKKEGKAYYCYECCGKTNLRDCDSRSYSRDRLEELICNYVKELFSPDTLAAIAEYLRSNMPDINNENNERLDRLTHELSGLKTKINKVVDVLIETPSEALKKRLTEYENRQRFIEAEIAALKSEELTEKKIDEYLMRVDNFDKLTRAEKQIFVSRAIKDITLEKDGKIKIQTTYNEVVCKLGGATQI